MAEFRLVVSGENGPQLVAELESELQELWPDQGPWRAAPPPQPVHRERSDWVGITGLILSIPSAVLAAMDLAERVKLASKLRRLRVWAQGKTVQVELPDGRMQALAEADPGEWIDIALEDNEAKAAGTPHPSNVAQ